MVLGSINVMYIRTRYLERLMGALSASNSHVLSGSVSVLVLGDGRVSLAVKDFNDDSDRANLTALLTIRGNLEKRKLDLGPLPEGETDFPIALPPGADVSLFDTLVLYDAAAEQVVGSASVA